MYKPDRVVFFWHSLCVLCWFFKKCQNSNLKCIYFVYLLTIESNRLFPDPGRGRVPCCCCCCCGWRDCCPNCCCCCCWGGTNCCWGVCEGKEVWERSLIWETFIRTHVEWLKVQKLFNPCSIKGCCVFMPSPNECLPVEPIHRLGPGGEVLEPRLLLTLWSPQWTVTSLLSGPELGQQETGQHLHISQPIISRIRDLMCAQV